MEKAEYPVRNNSTAGIRNRSRLQILEDLKQRPSSIQMWYLVLKWNRMKPSLKWCPSWSMLSLEDTTAHSLPTGRQAPGRPTQCSARQPAWRNSMIAARSIPSGASSLARSWKWWERWRDRKECLISSQPRWWICTLADSTTSWTIEKGSLCQGSEKGSWQGTEK